MYFSILSVIYLIASVSFILGLKMLSHPETARRGNLLAAGGMAIAIIGTIFLYEDPGTGERLKNYAWIFGGLVFGGIIGTAAAKKSENDSHARDGEYVQRNGWCLCRINLH